MNKTEFNLLNPKDQSALIEELCEDANRKFGAWRKYGSNLGSTYMRCAKLESFAAPLL